MARQTRMYKLWAGMIQRCTNPKRHNFKYYGGRGITVCDQWRESFARFLSDVGERPGDEYTLGRIDNNSGYFPGNVRWETRSQQMRNKRRKWYVEALGKIMTTEELAKDIGLSRGGIYKRLYRGLSGEAVLVPSIRHKEK